MPNDTAECTQCRHALPAGARFCPSCGAPVAAVAPAPPPTGERRQVAILFADLAGYTRMSSGLDAEDVHGILTRYFELADRAIERAGGTIDKHVGDAVMGVFGAPVAHGNDIERALRAALDIHAGMAAIAASVGRALAAHIGVASGEVVAAATGSDAHRAYTVTGDAVNLAARLTDVAKAGETAISDDVHRAVAALADVEALGDVAIRGLGEKQRVWKLLALRTPAAARVPLVGRDRERRRFASLLQEAAAGRRGAIVLVVAEPGMGKTRLAEAFMATALAEGAYCHVATVLDFGAGQGEDAVFALACSLLDVPPHASAAVRRDALTQAIAQGRADRGFEPYLADLLAVPQLPGSVYDAMDNDARVLGKRQALADVVTRTAARAPCVLLVEDLQWASPWVVDCLREIAASTASEAVMLVMTSRREGTACAEPWPADRTTRFDLTPLADADALTLARIHFATSPDLAQRCVDRAQGNPMFLVQLIRSGTDDDAVPASIQSVVLARLDRMPVADKHALQAAAVVGQRFGLDLLRTLIGEPGYEPRTPIERDLVRPVDDEPGVFTFAHALIRDGAYASLLHSARRDLHRTAATWYAERDVVLRARHLDRAGDPAAAAAYLAAARAEATAFHADAALALAQRGSELAAQPNDRYALAAQEGELLWSLGRAAESIAAYERARDSAADPRERAQVWIGIAAAHRLTSSVDEGLAALDEAARHATEPRDLARIHYLRGSLRFAQGEVAACEAEHARALAFAQDADDRESEALARSGLADALYAQGRMASARDMFKRCVELFAAEGATRLTIMNRGMIAIIDGYDGMIDAGLADLESAGALAHEVRHRLAETMSFEARGFLLVMAGRYEEARDVLQKGLALAREVRARRFESIICYSLSRVCWRNGEADEARRYADLAWCLARDVGPRFAGPIALGAVATVAASAADRRRALAEGERLLAKGCVAHCHIGFYRDAIELALAHGEWSEAERYAGALDDFMRPEPLRMTSLLAAAGMALAAAGRGAPDRAALEACRREAAAIGIGPLKAALDAALAAMP